MTLISKVKELSDESEVRAHMCRDARFTLDKLQEICMCGGGIVYQMKGHSLAKIVGINSVGAALLVSGNVEHIGAEGGRLVSSATA